MKLDKLKKDSDGAVGGKVLLVFIVVLALALLTLSGYLSFNLPGTATDEFTERVVRGATDTGMVVPIKIKLTFSQIADTSNSEATAQAYVEHQQIKGTDGNYVPDPTLTSVVEFNTNVGNVDDNTTIFSTNGNSFVASNIAYNSSLLSVSGANFGYGQNNYKVWTTGSGYTPVLTKDSSALLVQSVWKHYRKGTDELLSADTVNWIVNYEMPTYNTGESYTETYTYKVYVPFNNYAGDPSSSSAVIEDIVVDIRGYFEKCLIQWTTVTTVTHEYWNFPLLNKFFPSATGSISLVRSRDSVLATAIQYSWLELTDFALDNSAKYGSHTYRYKIR